MFPFSLLFFQIIAPTVRAMVIAVVVVVVVVKARVEVDQVLRLLPPHHLLQVKVAIVKAIKNQSERAERRKPEMLVEVGVPVGVKVGVLALVRTAAVRGSETELIMQDIIED